MEEEFCQDSEQMAGVALRSFVLSLVQDGKKIGVKRSKGDKRGTLDYHYLSPGGRKFKSKPEVKKFLSCLESPESHGDKDIAYNLYQNSRKLSTYQLYQIQETRWDMLTTFS